MVGRSIAHGSAGTSGRCAGRLGTAHASWSHRDFARSDTARARSCANRLRRRLAAGPQARTKMRSRRQRGGAVAAADLRITCLPAVAQHMARPCADVDHASMLRPEQDPTHVAFGTDVASRTSARARLRANDASRLSHRARTEARRGIYARACFIGQPTRASAKAGDELRRSRRSSESLMHRQLTISQEYPMIERTLFNADHEAFRDAFRSSARRRSRRTTKPGKSRATWTAPSGTRRARTVTCARPCPRSTAAPAPTSSIPWCRWRSWRAVARAASATACTARSSRLTSCTTAPKSRRRNTCPSWPAARWWARSR